MTKRDWELIGRMMAEESEYHATEVAFIKANPVFTKEVGEQKAKQFIVHMTALTEWMEKNWDRPGNEADPSPQRNEDMPAYYEVEAFFTPAQRAEVDALQARCEHVEMVHKAKDYDRLVETLNQIGLCSDMLLGEDGKFVDIISITDRSLANEWFRTAHVVEDDDDEDGPATQ